MVAGRTDIDSDAATLQILYHVGIGVVGESEILEGHSTSVDYLVAFSTSRSPQTKELCTWHPSA
jgi:hypothetical protein